MFTEKKFERLRSIDDIATLSPLDFEWFTKFLLEKKGHTGVWVTQKRGKLKGDGGVDVQSIMNGVKVYTQCKRWHSSFRGTFKGYLPVRVVRELGGCMLRDKVTKGIVVTTLHCEGLDRSEAGKMDIELIGREEIVKEMLRINPKFRKHARLRLLTLLRQLFLAIRWLAVD
jgi:HJR/Mrr/RecB family endonuclease